jgi:hypothetical protein
MIINPVDNQQTTKMDPTIKAKWIDALRSGKYRQGKGALHKTDNSFCCLGVLCDLALQEGIVTRQTSNVGKYIYTPADPQDSTPGSSSYLPVVVQEWAGMDNSQGYHYDRGLRRSLAALNDDHGLSFQQIAYVIEKEF